MPGNPHFLLLEIKLRLQPWLAVPGLNSNFFRNTERRVQHLEGERWDYKAWSYQPVSSAWVDNARWVAMQQKNQYEQYAHYPQ